MWARRFVGSKRIRSALGDGYAEALRVAYADVPDSADLVMFWWHTAAGIVARGDARQAGLITTNSITSLFNRRVLAARMSSSDSPCSIAFAIPDHPWVETTDGASVRIAMTVLAQGTQAGTLACT